MSAIFNSAVEFFRNLNLGEKLSPKKNMEIIWFYLFLPSLIFYLASLSSYLNEKPVIGRVDIVESVLVDIIPKSAKMEVIASGLNSSTGLVWQHDDSSPHLVFSDVIQNRIYKWEDGKGMFTIGKTVYLTNSGCRLDLESCKNKTSPGIAGMMRARDGSFDLLGCAYGDRAVVMLRENGTRFIVASHYKSHRLNSPNDLVQSPDGHLYFTDPLFGLYDKNGKVIGNELNHSGVYMIRGDYLQQALESGHPTAYVRLVESRLTFPGGLAFSPDYASLYVTNSDPFNSFINVYEVSDDGSLRRSSLFFNATAWYNGVCEDVDRQCGTQRVVVSGLKVDIYGNVFVGSSHGVFILSHDGKLLGRLVLDRFVNGLTFGSDGKLYIAADDVVVRLITKTMPARIIVGSKI